MYQGSIGFPKIWGHRGCCGKVNPPENSIAAFQEAFRQQADGIELDVFPTRASFGQQSRLVVFHDDTLERMTAENGKITVRTWEELGKLQLRANKSTKLTSETIPTLYAVLEAIGVKVVEGDAVVNIEGDLARGKNTVRLVVEAIERCLAKGSGWRLSNFLVSSFDMDFLRSIRMENQQIPVGVLLAEKNAPWDIEEDVIAEKLREIRDIRPETVNITVQSLTDKVASMIRDSGARPVAWTWEESDPGEISSGESRQLVERLRKNADVIITDYPGPMRDLLGKYSY